MCSKETIIELAHSNWDNMSQAELKKHYAYMMVRCESRKETCRKSSKQYYAKTFILKKNPTIEELEKNKAILNRRDAYQKDYYNKNIEKIKENQTRYRLERKLKKQELKEEELKTEELKKKTLNEFC
tara:strand:+ start:1331 stop:1711 length:381 start_codon:yes stop_codon:yes gene_type:complete